MNGKCLGKIKSFCCCVVSFCFRDASFCVRLRVEPWLTPMRELVDVVIYVAYCVEDIFTSWSMYPEQLLPLSWLWALSHSDSLAVKTLLTTTVSDKIALGTNNFIWMFCPSDILQTKMPQLLSPSVSSSTQRFTAVTDSQTQQGHRPWIPSADDSQGFGNDSLICSTKDVLCFRLQSHSLMEILFSISLPGVLYTSQLINSLLHLNKTLPSVLLFRI